MSNFEMWNLIVGFLLPPALAFVIQTGWDRRVQAIIAFAASAVAGAGVAYFQGDLTGERFVEGALIVLVATVATYQGFWKPTGVAPTIETTTNLQKGE